MKILKQKQEGDEIEYLKIETSCGFVFTITESHLQGIHLSSHYHKILVSPSVSNEIEILPGREL